MPTQFDSNTFEHDYILQVLEHLVVDLNTDKSKKQLTDKAACVLTAFMNGQIVAHIKPKEK